MSDRETALELADYLATSKLLAESRRDWLIKDLSQNEIAPLIEQIAKLELWEKMVLDIATQNRSSETYPHGHDLVG